MAEETIEEIVDLGEGGEVEIVDDTPVEDRNRKPLPDALRGNLEQDEELDGTVEEVRAKAQERLRIARKAWNDERREKERMERELEEAVKVAQMYHSRASQQQQQISTGETYLINQMQEKVKLELSEAKRAYKEAYESGDSDALAEAQERVSRATANAIQVEQWRPTQQQALQAPEELIQRQQAVSRQAEPQADPKAAAWAEANPWYGQDDEMTSFALGVHQRLVKEGVDPSGDEYYARINARVREKFPEAFKDTRSATVVASVGGRAPAGKGKKVTLTASAAALARKLGITPEQYAREVLKLGA